MIDDVFSFDEFLSRDGNNTNSPKTIREEIIKAIDDTKSVLNNEQANNEEKKDNISSENTPLESVDNIIDIPNNDVYIENVIEKESLNINEKETIKEEFNTVADKIEDNVVKEPIQNSTITETTNDDSLLIDELDLYKLYKDKDEEFNCNITVEGSSIEDTYVRLVLETENWNLLFNGELINGKCIIPIKRLNILKENEIGNIKLEVITEGNVFVPWEDKFIVKMSKKVLFAMNEDKKVKKPNNIGVTVNFKK